jgi:hypothetical protein
VVGTRVPRAAGSHQLCLEHSFNHLVGELLEIRHVAVLRLITENVAPAAKC